MNEDTMMYETLVCCLRRHQVPGVDTDPGRNRLLVPLNFDAKDEGLLTVLASTTDGLLDSFGSETQRHEWVAEDHDAAGMLAMIETVWAAMSEPDRLLWAAADLDMSLGDSLSEEDIERFRPLERALRESQVELRQNRLAKM